jgi:hypothetical protein
MSTRDQQKAKYWPTPKAYAALTPLDKGLEAALYERSVLDEGLRQMRSWTPEEVLEILEDAANILVTLRADIWCDWCDGPVTTPVRDAEAVSWLGKGAATYCSQTCLDAHDEARINAAGNEAS